MKTIRNNFLNMCFGLNEVDILFEIKLINFALNKYSVKTTNAIGKIDKYVFANHQLLQAFTNSTN